MKAAPLQATVRELFASTDELLWVGPEGCTVPGSSRAAAPAETTALEGTVDAVVWQPAGVLRTGLVLLKRCLRPGGRLLLWVELPHGPGVVLRLLGLRANPPRYSREALCESVLLAGLLEPRVLEVSRSVTAILATKPARPGPLDAVFAQPGE